jgi:hypothetical protein
MIGISQLLLTVPVNVSMMDFIRSLAKNLSMSREDHRRHDAELERFRKLEKESPRRHPVVDWFNGIGGVGLIVGLVGLIMTPFFWHSVALIYGSLLFLLVDVWFWNLRLKSAHVFWRIAVSTFLFAIGTDFGIEIVFLHAPLDITSYARLGNYGPGAQISGKEWKPEWIDLRVRINPPSYDYSDLDLQITPDLFRADEPWQATKIPCEPFQEVNHIPVQRTPLNPPGPKGESETIGPTVRMRCPVLPKQSTVEMIIPLRNLVPDNIPGDKLTMLNPPLPGVRPLVMIDAPKKLPEWVRISGTYKVRGRPHEFSGTYQPQALE